jgi:hypothetical protein
MRTVHVAVQFRESGMEILKKMQKKTGISPVFSEDRNLLRREAPL